MDTNADHLVTIDVQSDLTISNDVETILDLSLPTQSKDSIVIIKNWSNESLVCDKQFCDTIENDEWKLTDETTFTFDVEQSLTDQHRKHANKEDSLSDSSNRFQSKLEILNSTSKKKTK